MLDKAHRTERIIQFGEGGFLRGFVDWMLQIMNEECGFDANAVVVQPIRVGTCEMLEKQGCVYTHMMRGMRGGKPVVEKKIINSISRTVEPYRDFGAYLSLAENPDFRFIVSNTTEAGIAFNGCDRPEGAPEITFPAKLTLLMRRRYELGLGGFIILPCELIEKNGETLKKYVLDYARLWGYDDGFGEWVERENVFCSTLVDRIVTGYPKDEDIDLGYEDKMLNTSELFHLWVIETDYDLMSEIPFEKAGLNVIVTDDLSRYRTRKVRILNGAHTSLIPYALLEGVETVKECMDNEKLYAHVRACIYDEIIPTLDLGYDELKAYADDVLERFSNVYIRHLCSSIALNSVSKFKVRVLPSILEYVRRRGEMPKSLILAFAKLIELYRTDMTNDDAEVVAFMKGASVGEILSSAKLWGEDVSFLTDAVNEAMSATV